MLGRAILTAAALLILGATQVSADHRNSCESIRGTHYQHPGERDWYWQNCVLDIYGGGASSTPVVVASTDSAAQFAAGYTAAGGPAYYLDHILYNVIPCESTWNIYAVNYAGPFYGLMQFWPNTWHSVGGGDYFSAYQQGANTARLIAIADPGTQWPWCWYA